MQKRKIITVPLGFAWRRLKGAINLAAHTIGAGMIGLGNWLLEIDL